jgi:hypothetical protein
MGRTPRLVAQASGLWLEFLGSLVAQARRLPR